MLNLLFTLSPAQFSTCATGKQWIIHYDCVCPGIRRTTERKKSQYMLEINIYFVLKAEQSRICKWTVRSFLTLKACDKTQTTACRCNPEIRSEEEKKLLTDQTQSLTCCFHHPLSLIASLSLLLLFTVSGNEDCLWYVDKNGTWHNGFDCPLITFCCGNCHRRYCCLDAFKMITEREQKRCMLFQFRWGSSSSWVLI